MSAQNVLTVVRAIQSLAHKPCLTADTWIELICAVSMGEKFPMPSKKRFYQLMKVEPEAFQMLVPLLEITAPQGETLAAWHADPARMERTKKSSPRWLW